MRTQDLTPEQRRELLAAWDTAVTDYRNIFLHTGAIDGPGADRLCKVSAETSSRWFDLLWKATQAGASGPSLVAMGL